MSFEVLTRPVEPITQGTLRSAAGRVLPLARTDVRGRIDGPVASVEVRQVFTNDGPEPIEAVYSFPLPPDASVHRMEFLLAGRVVRAVVKGKEEARQSYDKARREGRSATLLEQDTPSLFTLSVANVPAGAAIEVRMQYQQVLEFDSGLWRFVFPLVAPERYHEGEPAPADPAGRPEGGPPAGGIARAGVRPPRLPTGERAGDVSLELEVRATGEVRGLECTHPVEVASLDGGGRRVTLRGQESIPNQDFVLAFGASGAGVRPAAFFEREAGKRGTFLLVLAPPAHEPGAAPQQGELRGLRCGNCGGTVTDMSAVKQIPGFGPAVPCGYCGAILAPTTEVVTRASRRRSVVLLVDRSASMVGSLEQARRAVRAVVEGLLPGDLVQVIAFDHERVAFDGDGSRFVAISPEVVARIDGFLAGLTPRGGSELEAALERVARIPPAGNDTSVVVLITDAAVGNEGRLLRRAQQLLGHERRLFVLGLGPAVDRRLVARLARACGGASDVLAPRSPAGRAGPSPGSSAPDSPGEPAAAEATVLSRFARRVRDGGPVLTGLSVSWEGARAEDVYPSPVPDLFGGQPVMLLGRFDGTGQAPLVITGVTVDGRPFRQEVTIELPSASEQAPGLARLWAKHRVDACLERLEREPGQGARIRTEVLSLGLEHSLVTPYTSLVAEDDVVVGKGDPQRVEVPTPHPATDGETTSAGSMHEPAPELVAFMERSRSESPAEFLLADCEEESRTAPDDECAVPVGRPLVSRLAGGPPPPLMAAPASPAPMAAAPSRPSIPAGARGSMSKCSPEALEETLGGGLDSFELDDAGVDPAPSVEGALTECAKPAARAPATRAPAVAAPPPPPSQTPIEAAGSDDYPADELSWLSRRISGELDLVFLVDETGSMGTCIAQVKARLLELVAALRRSPLCKSLRLGLVTYRDHPPQDRSYASRSTPLTDDIAAIEKAVNAMQASGGGDGPESVTDGLFDAVRLDWRPRAARAVVWFGDAPPHGVVPTGDGFPQGCPCGNHWFTQAENFREMGIGVYAVGCLPNLAGYPGGESVFRTVAATTRATYLPLSRASLLVPLIVGAAITELDKQRIDEHLADALAAEVDLLERTDEPERIRYLTDVLRAGGVRPRAMAYDPGSKAPSPLRFRELEPADVEASLDRLRLAGRAR